MNRQDYKNTIGLQVESLFDLVQFQVNRCFDVEKLCAMMSREEYAGLKRIILTGCGDSYSAAGTMAPMVARYSGLPVAVPDPMEFTRFYTEEEALAGFSGDEVLVVAISASGGAARIVEILEHARELGARSMLITNNPQSRGAQAARYVYNAETPDLCNTPGLRSYFASMVALAALGSFVGLCRGKLLENQWQEIPGVMVDYVLSCRPGYEAMDEAMFRLSLRWKDFFRFEIVGDEAELFSAQFVEQKFVECASVHCSHVDSEDWCHINFFLRDPQSVGTVFMVNGAAPDLDRVRESVRSALEIGRPVLVVTDAPADSFDSRAAVCRMPSPPSGYEWMLPLMDFAPGSLLSAYCAAVAGKLFFGGRYDYRTRAFLPEEQPANF